MSNTGRYYVNVNGRTFCVEPIDNTEGKGRKHWGDVNPSTKEIEGTYGNKYIGAINEDDTIITQENGFKNIINLKPGVSPESYINELIKK
jgi:hypothetical protein